MSVRYDEPPVSETTILVSTDVVNGEGVQLLKPAFGGPTEAKRVTESLPLPTRDYHGGTVPFDTGLVPVLAAGGVVTVAADVWIDVVLLSNASTEIQTVLLSSAAGMYILPDLEPHELRIVPFYGLKFAGGLAAQAAVDGIVSIQVKGTR